MNEIRKAAYVCKQAETAGDLELINRQALWLTCTGLPIGLLAGFLVGRSSMPVIIRADHLRYLLFDIHTVCCGPHTV